MKLRCSCGMALLGCSRCYRGIRGALLESVDEAAEVEQVLLRAKKFHGWWRRWRGVEVRPFGGNQRLTSVRQDEYKLQAGGHAGLAKDLERLPMKRMMRADNSYAFREVLMMGSVSWFPSIPSITNC